MKSFSTFFLIEGKDREKIRHAVWTSWKHDPFMAPHQDHWDELGHDEHKEFEQHVSDVHAHAVKHKIKDADKAVDSYSDHITPDVKQKIADHKRLHLH